MKAPLREVRNPHRGNPKFVSGKLAENAAKGFQIIENARRAIVIERFD